MNSLFALIPIAIVLSLDNFQSSIGLGTTKPPWRRIVQAAFVFSACDALAPLIGVWAGNFFSRFVGPVAEYAGAAALGAYALYLVVHAMRTEEAGDLDHPLAILGMPLPLRLEPLGSLMLGHRRHGRNSIDSSNAAAHSGPIRDVFGAAMRDGRLQCWCTAQAQYMFRHV